MSKENTIRMYLNKALIKFIYKTKNGNRRFASGTTNKKFLLKNFGLELKDQYNLKDGLITYYDTDKRNWRSFITDNFKEYTHIYFLNEDGNIDLTDGKIVEDIDNKDNYYFKVIGKGEYNLGYTDCKETWLQESLKEGWKKEELNFIKLFRV